MRNQQVASGFAFDRRAPKALALTGVCIAVLAAWQPWSGAAAEVDLSGGPTPAVEAFVLGAWDGPYCWPIGATHLAHLPPSGESQTGRVLILPIYSGDDDSIPAWLWNPQPDCFEDYDPDSECFTDVSNNTTNIFCAGHTALADGTILTAGGHRPTYNGHDVGLPDTNHFIRDPFTGEWGVWKTFEDGMPEMAEPRWYPTVTTLPDGRALVVSGSNARCSDNGEQCDPADPIPAHACPENETCDIVIVSIPEIYDPAADPLGWTQLVVGTVGMDVPYYPLNFVLPDGTVLYAGAEGAGGGEPSIPPTQTWVLDLDAEPPGNWTQQGDSSIPGGSAVMYAVPGDEGCPDEWKVLKSGGGGAGVDGAAVFDWEAGTWTDVDSMNHGRRRHQLTLLPDGTVLATGGTRRAPAGRCGGGDDEGASCDPDNDNCDETCVALGNRGNREYASFCNGGERHGEECSTVPPLLPNCAGNTDTGCGDGDCVPGEQLWVATAEIYDPDADTWTEMAEAQHPRMYHSTTLLLPDGRVVSAGGGPGGGSINQYRTVEFFSPPYYFKERPEIASAPSAICYDETFQMTSPDAVDVSRVTLIRLGTVTHSFDSDQRFQELTIAGQGANLLDVVAPENANVAPPGYYMLFVITEDDDGNDVPSVGKYVQVVECCIPTITIPGPLVFDDTCVGDNSTATLEVCNTGCADLEVTSIMSSDPQFSATEPSSGFPVAISPDFCFPFQVVFAPSGPGPQSAILAVSSNDPTEPTVQVEATGAGTGPDIAAFIADNGYFGEVCLGNFKDLDLTIVNNGGCDLILSEIASDNVEFVVPSKPPPALTVGPGNSLVVSIRYQPVDLGASGGTITITSNDPDTPEKTVAVSGNTPPGDITVTGSTDFGDVCAEELAEKVLEVCNVGACNLQVDSASIDCPDFTIINNPFPATVSPDFCMGLTIRFTPTSAGPKVCNLTITSDDPDTPVVVVLLTGNTPIPSIDVPPNLAFAPTVVQAVDACETFEPFPVSNTGICNLEITELEIAENADEYSLAGLPSFPIILQPGHQAGSGDLSAVFAPLVLDRERLGEVSVTYVSDPITGATMTVNRALCGEGVKTGARVLVTHGGVPLDVVKMIKLRRVTGNNNQGPIDTVETASDVELQQVTPLPPCPSFQYHREYGTVSNPIQLLPGSYLVTVKAQIPDMNGFQQQTVGFDVSSCDFNPNITVDF